GRFSYIDAKQKYYDKVRQTIGERGRRYAETNYALAIDLSAAFDQKEKSDTWFGDRVHYLPAGRDVIVDKLLTRMKDQINWGLMALRSKGCG
ncbi:MAG: hypothetical protein ACR2PF_13435, partial [Rhizobiaceae bacterium]